MASRRPTCAESDGNESAHGLHAGYTVARVTGPKNAGIAHNETQGDGMRIAALDDESCQLELIRHTMETIGHECHGFTDGKSLLRDLHQQTYDLLILDWSLPDIQGPQVTRWIREDLNNSLPILFVTKRHEIGRAHV